MPKHIVKRRRWTLSLLAAGLIALLAAVAPPPAFADEAKFTVPIVIGGITYQGEGVLAEDGSIVVTVRIIYKQAVPGPKPPPIVVDPPEPLKDKPNKLFVIWESSGNDAKVADLVRRKEAWKKEAEKLGITVIIADKDPAATTYPVAVKKAIEKGLPAVVWAKDATQLGVDALPKDEAALISLLQKKAGGK